MGGETITFYSREIASKKNGRFSISSWAGTRMEAAALARSIEDTLVESTTLRGEAVGAFLADIDIELQRFGTIQDFRFVFND